jgi:hypothetical protein
MTGTVTYNSVERTLRIDIDKVSRAPITEIFSLLWGPVSDLPIFSCDWGRDPLGEGVTCFAVRATKANLRALEVWLRTEQRDLASVRQLRTAFPELEYDSLPILERLRIFVGH